MAIRRLRRLARHNRGATAIEYAVIAGLIGLGLVGSLVATRGSLSSVFGTASSQMSSGVSGSGSASGATGSASWSTKTIASRTVSPYNNGQATQYKYTFTDGSLVTYTVTNDAQNYPYNPSLEMYTGTSPKTYYGYRQSTATFPNGILYIGQETGANTGAYSYPTALSLKPDGTATDQNTNKPYTGALADIPGYQDTVAAYQYFGTLP